MSSAPASSAALRREPELLGQTVVVIGGSAGIGLETARRARAEGAEVILAARDPDRLALAAAEVDARDTAAFDATDHDRLEGFFADLPSPLDHVMVTAGRPSYAPLAELDLGLIAAVTAALPALVANLALEIAPVRGQPHRAGLRRHPVVGGAARRRARGVDGGQQFTPDAWS